MNTFMCGGPMGGWMAGLMIVNLVIGLGLVALLIVGVVALVRWLWPTLASRPEDRALAILRERYARGDINREEFEARRQDLSSL